MTIYLNIPIYLQNNNNFILYLYDSIKLSCWINNLLIRIINLQTKEYPLILIYKTKDFTRVYE